MTRVRVAATACAGAAVVVMAVLSCGPGTTTTELVVDSGQHPQLMQALKKDFEVRNPTITLSVKDGDSRELAGKLALPGGASTADVFISENSPELMFLSEKHVLATLSAATLSAVPAQFSSPNHDWVGMAGRVSALVYNTAQTKPADLPSSILDLADVRWQGKVAISAEDSDFAPIVAAVLATYGQPATASWLAGLKRNAVEKHDIEAIVSDVDDGQVPVGVVNSYYWYRLQLEKGPGNLHSALFYFPNRNPGSVENIAGAAVLSGSSHKTEAEQFVAYLAGAEGQQVIAQGDDFEYPLRPGVSANPALPPLSRINPAVIDIARLGDDEAAVKALQDSGLVG
jgi:iron(III) transport system substrate-binding protein